METKKKIHYGESMKKSVLMCAPFNTRSGYGDHARSIYYSIMDRDDLDIKCIDVKWGSTPRNHLRPEVPKHKKLLESFIDPNGVASQPDIYIDIRIPNEFSNPGKFNIGITAGVETDIVSPEFLVGMNKMNLNIVPSNFTAETFQRCNYDQMQEQPDGKKVKTGSIKLDRPISVLFEGVDTDIYKPLDKNQLKSNLADEVNELVKEEFVYLHVGQLGKGGYGEDRKNITLMVKCFLQAFSNTPNPPALLLKTNGANFSVLDRAETLKRIKKQKDKFSEVDTLPNIYLLHGDLTVDEMSILYNLPKIKAMLSCTHGEGYGRPLAEATCCDLPVIASKWSGHMDFLTETESLLIDGFVKEVPKSMLWKPIIVEPSKWFNVTETDVIRKVRLFYKKHKLISKKALRLGKKNRREKSLTAMSDIFNKVIDDAVKSIPTEIGLKLPKLQKVGGTTPPPSEGTIKLPKLKKVT
tara:strand:- start:687 stop:2087 length:1401 start_codon:yes stop_codon:yes gene_type:complete